MEVKFAIEAIDKKYPFYLSPHFKAWEFLLSRSNPDLSAKADPTPQEWTNMHLLATLGLTPIRLKYGVTTITSGYRSYAINNLVGGSPTSQHRTGEAVDFLCKAPEVVMEKVYEDLDTWWPGQLFYYKKAGHVHMGLPRFGLPPTHKKVDK